MTMAGLNRLSGSVAWLSRTALFKCKTLCQARSFTKVSPDPTNLTEMHKPTKFERKILVLAGSYKSTAEVPDRVTTGQLTRAKDLFRIRVNIGMIIATVFGCIIMVWSGKRARAAGDTISKRGEAQIREWELKGEQQRAAKAAMEAKAQEGK